METDHQTTKLMNMKKLFLTILLLASGLMFAQDETQNSIKQSNILMMQAISVTIGGDFIVTGSFTAAKSQRLDHFITTVFVEAQTKALSSINNLETIKLINKEINRYALRNITLKRSGGEVQKIDLLKFRLTGNFQYNPYLKMDDVIVFPAYDNKRDIVDISGAVNKPTQFQYVDGDRLADAILFAGGINPAFENLDEVEISRIVNGGKSEQIIKTTISENPVILRGDRITIMYNDNYKKMYKILVLGEVGRPGYVYALKDNSTLREVLKKAGGVNLNADLKRAEFLRATEESQTLRVKALRETFESDTTVTTLSILRLKIEEVLTEENRMVRSSNITRQEFEEAFAPDLYLKMIETQTILDFTKVQNENSEEGNTIVREGDVIIIPAYQNIVYVFGQVRTPGYYQFQKSKDWNYYTGMAGGFTERAKDEEEVRIINGSTRTWYNSTDSYEIQAGDLIYVPKNLPKDLSYYLNQFGSIASIASTIVTLTYIILQSTK